MIDIQKAASVIPKRQWSAGRACGILVTMPEVPTDALETRFYAAVKSGEQGPALEAIRTSLQEFDARGVNAVADDLHPDFELHMETLLLDGRVYHGIEGLNPAGAAT
jgi:hypothetical protein